MLILTILIACISTTISFPQIIQLNNNISSFRNKTGHLDKKHYILFLASTGIIIRCDPYNIENESIGREDVKWSVCAKMRITKKMCMSLTLLSDLYFFKGIV